LITNQTCRQSPRNHNLQIKLRNSSTNPRDQTSRAPRLKMRVALRLRSQKVVSHFQSITTINHNLSRVRSRAISATTITIREDSLIANSIRIGTASSSSNTTTIIIDLKTTRGAEEANIPIQITIREAAVVITRASISGTHLWAVNNQTCPPISKPWRKWLRS